MKTQVFGLNSLIFAVYSHKHPVICTQNITCMRKIKVLKTVVFILKKSFVWFKKLLKCGALLICKIRNKVKNFHVNGIENIGSKSIISSSLVIGNPQLIPQPNNSNGIKEKTSKKNQLFI